MASIAQLEGFYYKPRIDMELLAAHSKGPHRHERLPAR
jgi:DNA polymerase-3 subunit alpha